MTKIPIEHSYVMCHHCNGTGRVPNKFFTGYEAQQLRKQLKLTLKQVSTEMGISVGYLSDMEQGRKPMSQDTLRAWSISIRRVVQQQKKKGRVTK